MRPVAQAERRVSEASTMGFKRVIMPKAGAPLNIGKRQQVEVVLCATLADAVREALGMEPARRKSGGRGSAR